MRHEAYIGLAEATCGVGSRSRLADDRPREIRKPVDGRDMSRSLLSSRGKLWSRVATLIPRPSAPPVLAGVSRGRLTCTGDAQILRGCAGPSRQKNCRFARKSGTPVSGCQETGQGVCGLQGLRYRARAFPRDAHRDAASIHTTSCRSEAPAGAEKRARFTG